MKQRKEGRKSKKENIPNFFMRGKICQTFPEKEKFILLPNSKDKKREEKMNQTEMGKQESSRNWKARKHTVMGQISTDQSPTRARLCTAHLTRHGVTSRIHRPIPAPPDPTVHATSLPSLKPKAARTHPSPSALLLSLPLRATSGSFWKSGGDEPRSGEAPPSPRRER